jgi:hypothetical protein
MRVNAKAGVFWWRVPPESPDTSGFSAMNGIGMPPHCMVENVFYTMTEPRRRRAA